MLVACTSFNDHQPQKADVTRLQRLEQRRDLLGFNDHQPQKADVTRMPVVEIQLRDGFNDHQPQTADATYDCVFVGIRAEEFQ